MDKIEKEIDYMELCNNQFKMGLINVVPYMEQINHHINKIREYINEDKTSHSDPQGLEDASGQGDCTRRTCRHSYTY